MSPISLGLNLLLASLLLATLWLGAHLNRRLKALKDSHAGFTAAVVDLDRAATRAERGLADLRAATDEAVEFLAGRIEKGRELAAKLERLTTVAAAAADRSEAIAATAPPIHLVQSAPPSSQMAQLEKLWGRAANESSPRAPADADVAAESLILRLSEVLDRGAPPFVQRQPPPLPARPRTSIDDDLFDAPVRPAQRAFGGAR